MYSIVDCSPAALEKIAADVGMTAIPERQEHSRGRSANTYPFRAMMPRQSFAVPYGEDFESTFNRTSKAASDASKRFKPARWILIKHEVAKLIEVVRIK